MYKAFSVPVVIGHSSFALTAIILSAQAGLLLRYRLLSPRVYNRLSPQGGKDRHIPDQRLEAPCSWFLPPLRRSSWEAADTGLILWRTNLFALLLYLALPLRLMASGIRLLPPAMHPWSYFLLWWLKPLFDIGLYYRSHWDPLS